MSGEQVLFLVVLGWAVIATLGWIIYSASVRSDITFNNDSARRSAERADEYRDQIAKHKREEDYWRAEYSKLSDRIDKAKNVLGGKG